jgi:hypothetical protein
MPLRWRSKLTESSPTIIYHCTGTITHHCTGTITHHCTETIIHFCTGTITHHCTGTITHHCTEQSSSIVLEQLASIAKSSTFAHISRYKVIENKKLLGLQTDIYNAYILIARILNI